MDTINTNEPRYIRYVKKDFDITSIYLNMNVLRRMYFNDEPKGHIRPGYITRHKLSSTNRNFIQMRLCESTMNMLSELRLPRAGGYRTHYVELSLRFLTSIILNGEDVEAVTEELADVCISPYILLNLQRVYKILSDRIDRKEK